MTIRLFSELLELFFFVHFSFFSGKKKVNLFQAKTGMSG
ncbi:hypothetical protein LEP1GSC068_2738 [Leptospira sp. Fiocruz LV3954]|nr:hypothetical protein LEP1GSC068_2738 [Leptospira sp. Fiocruz LV3954]